MVFWAIIGVLAAAVAAVMIRALLRPVDLSDAAQTYDLKVYRDQLAEVDRDLARGVVNAEDAERVRTEISRRILAADAASQGPEETGRSVGAAAGVAGVIALVVIAGSAGIYQQLGAPGYGDLGLSQRIAAAETLRETRPDQASAEASLPPALPNAETGRSVEYLALVEQLRKVVEQRPDDAEGARLLAISERNLGNFSAAHRAFGTYLAIKGDAATGAEHADYADMLVLAAGGYVSPEAEDALRSALTQDPGNGIARYYQGLMEAQTARPDRAFQIWDRLLRQGPPEAPWIQPIQAQIDQIALRAGINYDQPLPGGGRGPSSQDIEAAGQMSAADRMQMIEGMVEGLSERLANEGGTVNDWARLITSLGVLGRQADAFAVYQNAVEVFGNDPTAMDNITRAGQQANVIE